MLSARYGVQGASEILVEVLSTLLLLEVHLKRGGKWSEIENSVEICLRRGYSPVSFCDAVPPSSCCSGIRSTPSAPVTCCGEDN